MKAWLEKLSKRCGWRETEGPSSVTTDCEDAFEWGASVCAVLEPIDGSAEHLSTVRTFLTENVPWLKDLYTRAELGPEDELRLVDFLLYVGASADTGNVRPAGARLRAFTDTSVQQAVLAVLIRRLAASDTSRQPIDIASLIVSHRPAFEAGHALLCELLIEAGETVKAEGVARELLARSCFSVAAEKVLRRVAARRNEGAGPREDHLKERFCEMPFTSLYTSYQGGCFGCVPMWLPYALGELKGCRSLDDVWNSEAAREIRRSILDGDYSYCSREFCTQLRTNGLPVKSDVKDPRLRRYIDGGLTWLPDPPTVVSLSHDGACNLACPSCRSRAIGNDPALDEELEGWKNNLILPLLAKMDGACVLSCNGDPLASRHYSGILSALNRTEFPRLNVLLITNGQLLTPAFWATPVADMIFGVTVSVDAACAETYEQVRPPAKWDRLMANLRYASEQRKQGRIHGLNLCFVVQRDNFRQMPDFVRLGIELGVDTMIFQRYVSFGTDDPSEVKVHDVCSADHPMHGDFLKVIADPVFEHRTVTLLVHNGGVETAPPSILQNWLRNTDRSEGHFPAAATHIIGAVMP